MRALRSPPAEDLRDAMKLGLFDIFLDAGCAVSTPTCGPCLGGPHGHPGQGERCVATTNRNIVGRHGHPGSEVYLGVRGWPRRRPYRRQNRDADEL